MEKTSTTTGKAPDGAASISQDNVEGVSRASSQIAPGRFSLHVGGTFAARVLMAVNSVGAGVIVARWLGADGFGMLAVLNVTVSITIHLSSFGVSTANTYFVGRDHNRLVPAAFNSLLFALLSGGAFALGVWACAIWNPTLLAHAPGKLVALALLGVPFQLVSLLGSNLFLTLGYVKRFNFLDFLNQSFVLINAAVALLLIKGGLWMLVSLNTLASIAVSVLVCVLLYRHIARRFRPKLAESALSLEHWRADPDFLKQMMRYALKGHILWVATIAIYRVDLLIVTYFRSAAEAGVYAVAAQCTFFLMLLPNVVSQLLLSRVAATQDQGGMFTCQATRYTSLILVAACVISFPSSLLLPRLYGQGFADAPVQLWLLLPGVYFVGLQSVLVQYFVGTGLPRLIPTLWVLMLALNITLNWLLIPLFGARGAACVSTFSYALIFCVVFLYFRLQTHHRLTEILFVNGDDLRRVLALQPFQRKAVQSNN
jgi:O-antigen/teichoic acid export membrane protein